jgi:aryl-alcohol dehydrogenase-like predicted oxidoreductase
MTETTTRVLGRSGIRVSAMGLGGWAIGGPFTFAGRINPGLVFDHSTDLDHVADAYAAMDERRAIKSLLVVSQP